MFSPHCTIYFIRHAESEGNVANLVHGRTDAPLTVTGISQAKKLARKLAPIQIAAVYTSDLGRAVQTATIIAKPHHLAVLADRNLRERYYGELEGQSMDDFSPDIISKINSRQKMSFSDRMQFRLVPHYESDTEIVARMLAFIDQIIHLYPQQTILAITHGSIMRILLVYLKAYTYAQNPQFKNSGYVIIRSDGTDFFIDDTVGITKKF